MTYILKAEPGEVAWFRGLLSAAESVASRYGLPSDTTSIAVGVGAQSHESSAYKHGYRGPGTSEGQRVLEMLRGLVWKVRGACGPWEPSVQQRPDQGTWQVFAAVDLPVGVCQVVRLDTENRAYSVYSTMEVPSLDDWLADDSLRMLDETQAAAVVLELIEAHRVDALPALLDKADSPASALC